MSGRTSGSSVTEGALVTASQATALVTVTQLDPMYVDVTQPATVLLRLQRELEAGQLVNRGANAAAVGLKLEDGSEYGRGGSFKFCEGSVHQDTGHITIQRAVPTPSHLC